MTYTDFQSLALQNTEIQVGEDGASWRTGQDGESALISVKNYHYFASIGVPYMSQCVRATYQ